MPHEPDIVFYGLSTGVRHALMDKSCKLHQTARLLDAFFAFGCEEGDIFTRQIALAVGTQVQMSKKVVEKALKATLSTLRGDPCPVFREMEVALESPRLFTPKFQVPCLGPPTGKLGVKNQRGRPVKWYQMPSMISLLKVMDVEDSRMDFHPLRLSDLRSIKRYRIAVQRAYTSANPGRKQSRARRGALTGVSGRTSAVYDKALGTLTKSTEVDTKITAANAERYLSKPMYRSYLVDEAGERHVASLETAQALLAQGHAVVYHRRGANRYYPALDEVGLDLDTHREMVELMHGEDNPMERFESGRPHFQPDPFALAPDL